MYCFSSSELRLLNLAELTSAGASVDLMEFQSWSRKAIDSVRNQLMNIWYPSIQNIYCQVSYVSNIWLINDLPSMVPGLIS